MVRTNRHLPYSMVQAETSDRVLYRRENNRTSKSRSGDGNRNGSTLVHLAPSNVCKGMGVFSSVFLPHGSYVTAYPGRVTKMPGQKKVHWTRLRRAAMIPRDGQSYLYVFNNNMKVDGRQVPSGNRWWRLHGLGNMMNDAIHPDVTGRQNNCEFVEVHDVPVMAASAVGRLFRNRQDSRARSRRATRHADRLYIRTCRDIHPGEELLVPYSMEYWMAYLRDPIGKATLSAAAPLLVEWLLCHDKVEETVSACCGFDCTLVEYKGFHSFEGEGYHEQHEEDKEDIERGVATYVVDHHGMACCDCCDDYEHEEEQDKYKYMLRYWVVDMLKKMKQRSVDLSVSCKRCRRTICSQKEIDFDDLCT